MDLPGLWQLNRHGNDPTMWSFSGTPRDPLLIVVVLLLLISKSSRSFSVSHNPTIQQKCDSPQQLHFNMRLPLLYCWYYVLLFVSMGYYVECVKLCVRGLLILSRADIRTFIMDRHMYDKIMRFQRHIGKNSRLLGTWLVWMDVMWAEW